MMYDGTLFNNVQPSRLLSFFFVALFSFCTFTIIQNLEFTERNIAHTLDPMDASVVGHYCLPLLLNLPLALVALTLL
jgi:hypothetical protein